MKEVILSDGTKVTVREPLVGDSLASSVKGDDVLTEINLVANITGLSVDEIKKLTMKDYSKIQQVVMDFLY